LTMEQGLSLVRKSCRRMEEQVSTLRRRYDRVPPGSERDPKAARVIEIRNSPTISAAEAHTASVDGAQASARATNKRTA
jgi:hypothetical protein